ncbi:MAG: nucleoside/nucleotide kinase family protein [Candidatus Saccharibacteria bacterium]|nr:nucleoside/nucleotide kinase family protein [Pseudorhodobacter sp.]
MTPIDLADVIKVRAEGAGRYLVGLAGPPGAGKSALAAELVGLLGQGAKAVAMGGFHYDDAVLGARGARARKGAPDTFDTAGFFHLLRRLRDEDEVAIPLFDRDLEISRAGAAIVTAADRVLVVEGNYLLLNEAPWPEGLPSFDLTVWIEVPEAELDRRLMARWAHYGKSLADARAWVDGNDLPNIRRVTQGSRAADLVLHWS